MIEKFYGVKKGSKKPKRMETPLTQGKTFKQAQLEYDQLLEKRTKLIHNAVRYAKVANIVPGDEIPSELVEIRSEIMVIDKRLSQLISQFPRLNR